MRILPRPKNSALPHPEVREGAVGRPGFSAPRTGPGDYQLPTYSLPKPLELVPEVFAFTALMAWVPEAEGLLAR